MQSLVKQNRIGWIDTAKGIGLLLVILGHTRLPYASSLIYTFHIPLFFFLSGAVFSGTKYGFKEFFVKKFKSLVIPYFCLGAVIFLFFSIVYAVQGEPLGAYTDMLFNFLRQEHFWTIWFLAGLFITEIIYYWINKLLCKYKFAVTAASVIVCVLGLLRYRLGFDGLPWNIDIALVAQFFFHLGYRFKLNEKLQSLVFREKTPAFLLTAAALFIINVAAGVACMKVSGLSLDMSVGLYGNEPLTMISAVSGILFTVCISNKINLKFLTYLGQNTMIIFSWHSRIIMVLCDMIFAYFVLLQGTDLVSKAIYAVVVTAASLIVLIPVNELIKRTKAHKLFGV